MIRTHRFTQRVECQLPELLSLGVVAAPVEEHSQVIRGNGDTGAGGSSVASSHIQRFAEQLFSFLAALEFVIDDTEVIQSASE